MCRKHECRGKAAGGADNKEDGCLVKETIEKQATGAGGARCRLRWKRVAVRKHMVKT